MGKPVSSMTKIPRGLAKGPRHHASDSASQTCCSSQGLWLTNCCRACSGSLDVEQFGGPGDAGGHRLDALALAILEQAAEVDAAPGVLGLVAEVVAEQLGVVAKPIEDFGGQFGGVGLVHTDPYEQSPREVRRILTE